MENLSVGQAAAAKAAASKLKGKSFPVLSRPPGHSGNASSPTQEKTSADATLDLLSGFELDGASNSNANASVPAPAAAVDMFAAFATPAAGMPGDAGGQQGARGGGLARGFGELKVDVDRSSLVLLIRLCPVTP